MSYIAYSKYMYEIQDSSVAIVETFTLIDIDGANDELEIKTSASPCTPLSSLVTEQTSTDS